MERTAAGEEHGVILRGGDNDSRPSNKAAVDDGDIGGCRGGEADDEQESQKDRAHQNTSYLGGNRTTAYFRGVEISSQGEIPPPRDPSPRRT